MSKRLRQIESNWSESEPGSTAVMDERDPSGDERLSREREASDNFTDGPKLREPEWLPEARSELFSLNRLKPGWDSYDGRPPSYSLALDAYAAIQAIYLQYTELSQPQVSATPKAGIELYWSTAIGNLSILFESSGHHRLRFTKAGSREVSREPFTTNETAKLVGWVRRLDS